MPTVTSQTKAEFDREFLKKKGLIKDEVETEAEPTEKNDLERIKQKKDEQIMRAKKHPKYARLKTSLGHKGAVDAILKELNDKQ